MTKKQKAIFILKLLNKQGYKYEVLSISNAVPNHVRVKGFGDVWPSTGTYRINDKTHKGDLAGLVKKLGGKMPVMDKSNTERIEALEEDNKKIMLVTTRLLGCLAVELGTVLTSELINELNELKK